MMDLNDMLQMRLDQNYKDYVVQLRGMTADQLIAFASEITAAQQLREELACACSEEDAALLLQFDDPLAEMRGFWANEQDGCHSGEISHMIGELQCRGEFPVPPAKPESDKAKNALSRSKRGQER